MLQPPVGKDSGGILSSDSDSESSAGFGPASWVWWVWGKGLVVVSKLRICNLQRAAALTTSWGIYEWVGGGMGVSVGVVDKVA